MKLAEIYANNCGVKLPDKPVEPFKSYYPVLGDYISIHNGSGMESKNYDYFSEVIEILRKRLSGVKFVQIGTHSEHLLPHCEDLRGKTNLYQGNYVVANALAHIDNDSLWTHNAGALGTPSVSVYGPTLSEVCAPFYHHPKSVFIDSHRNNLRATHSAKEFPKTINYIKPEEIANGVLEVLGLPKSKQTSLHIGTNYQNPIIEVVPDHPLPNNLFINNIVNIRLDLGGSEEILPYIAKDRKASLITDRRLDPNVVRAIRPSLITLIYKVNEKVDMKFVEEVAQSGIDYTVATENVDILDNLKFDLLSFNAPKKIVRPEMLEGDFSNSVVKSSKILCAGGKFYLSEWHFDAKLPLNSLGENLMQTPNTKDETFWKDSNNYYIFRP